MRVDDPICELLLVVFLRKLCRTTYFAANRKGRINSPHKSIPYWNSSLR